MIRMGTPVRFIASAAFAVSQLYLVHLTQYNIIYPAVCAGPDLTNAGLYDMLVSGPGAGFCSLFGEPGLGLFAGRGPEGCLYCCE